MLEWTREGVCCDEGGVLVVDQTVWWAPEWTWRWEVSETAKKANKQNIINKTFGFKAYHMKIKLE